MCETELKLNEQSIEKGILLYLSTIFMQLKGDWNANFICMNNIRFCAWRWKIITIKSIPSIVDDGDDGDVVFFIMFRSTPNEKHTHNEPKKIFWSKFHELFRRTLLDTYNGRSVSFNKWCVFHFSYVALYF